MDPASISREVSSMRSVAMRGFSFPSYDTASLGRFERVFADKLKQDAAYHPAAQGMKSKAVVRASGSQTTSTNTISGSQDFLGKDDFLQLLVTQLRCQSVAEPVDQKELIAQMAQLASLEEMQNMSVGIQNLLGSQIALQAASLVGKTAVATLPDGTKVEGVIQEVKFDSGLPILVVNNQNIPISHVTSVR
ncbi:MAG: hypothetical protein HPY52_00690 [Firmicutes bacterium]|nr:hypothetical protein [Bacillota bacterium]